MKILKRLVKVALGAGSRRPHRIRSGAFRGLTLHLDASYATTTILGLYERETHSHLEKLADGLGTAIDIGAAEGEFTVFFLKTAHAKKVLAFEPNPENRENFLTNLKLNGLADDDRLKVIKKYLGQKEDDEWTSLDSFVEELREPVLVKMDVDGGEVEVLLGAKKLLRMPGIRFLIETHSAELEAQCIRILNDSGFTTQIIYNAWWRYFVKDQRPIAHNRWLVGYRSTDQTH